MISKKRRFFQTIALISTLLLVTLMVAGCGGDEEQKTGSDFPNKPVELIVSYSAGAATDAQARPLLKYFPDVFNGQPLVIVNMPGAGGTTGWNHFAKQKPDGYTLCAYNMPHIFSKPLVQETAFTWEDFEPIANWGYDPVVFAVLPDSPYKTLEDLINGAKDKPETITIGSAGLYVGQHLAQLQLEDAAGIKLKQVPFDGAADAAAALLGKQIDVVSSNLSDMYRLGDKVRILAVAAEERHEYIPDVPTFKELGYPQVVMSTDRGIAAPKGTPPEILEILSKGFMEIMNNEEYQKDMEKLGAPLMIMSRDEMLEDFEKRAKDIEALLTKLGEVKTK